MGGQTKTCSVHKVAYWLMWAGAINWGLVGAFKFNLVAAILGFAPFLVSLVYMLVGVAAVLALFAGKCKMCLAGGETKKI